MQGKSALSVRSLTVRQKITSGTGLLLIALLAIAAYLAIGLRTLNASLHQSEQAQEITEHLHQLDKLTGELEAALQRDQGGVSLQLFQSYFAARDGFISKIAQLSTQLSDDQAQAARLEQLKRHTDPGRWRRLLGNPENFSEIRSALAEVRSALEEIEAAQTKAIAAQRSASQSLSSSFLLNVGLLCLAVIAVTIIASQRLARRIVGPITQMTLAAERVMLGDLAPRVEEQTNDEIGQLARVFNQMAERIAEREKAVLARNRELDELHDFNALLQTSATEEEIHRALLQKIRNLEPTQVVILDRQNEDNTLAVAASLNPLPAAREDHPAANLGYDPAAETDEPEFNRQQIPLCRVVRSGREIVVQDVADDLLCADCRFGQKRGSSFCVPITAGGKTIGALHVASPKTEYWSEDRQRMVRMLVDQAAPTINNLRSMRTLEDRTFTDEQTRVYNRRYLDDFLKRQIGLARRHEFPVSVMMLDIDYFKRLNDRYGHEAGDTVLRHFAATIAGSLREGELVARYGGEEFTIVMNGTARAAQTLAERLRRAVAALSFPQLAQQGEEVRITMSIGIAEFPSNGQTVEDVLKAADFALYRAKDSGRNCVKLASRTLMAIKGAQISRTGSE